MAACQVGFLLLVWTFVGVLHWGNDGLWYRGDAAVHAANGMFWRHFLAHPSLDPEGVALSYYARYPSISPSSYPPLFYVLEAGAYSVFGSSPRIAKGLVLGFALVAALYVWAWLRRWVAVQAGFAAGAVMLLPGMVRWSHAIMLNVPSTALALGSMYHMRRWLEVPSRCQIASALGLAIAAVMTFPSAAVVAPLMIVAAIAVQGRTMPPRVRWLVGGLMVAIPASVLALLGVASLVSPSRVTLTLPRFEKIGTLANWSYYPASLPGLFGPVALSFAAVGLAAGAACPRWRTEVFLQSAWILVVDLAFSVIRAREPRYILLMAAPIVVLAVIGVLELTRWAGSALSWRRMGVASACASAALPLALAWPAARTRVPRVEGIRRAVEFLERVAPDDAYFYDGDYYGVFTAYVQVGDPGYRRRVVRGNKLLYTYAQDASWRAREFVSSPREAVEALRHRGGARWIVVEAGPGRPPLAAARHLREAVQGPDFELIRSFPLEASGPQRLDIYRLRGPIRPVDEVDLPFQIIGEGVRYRTRIVRPDEGGDHGR